MDRIENGTEAERFEDEYEARLEREADDAVERIKKGQSWNDWLKIGELFAHGRKRSMLRGGANKPEGKGYNMAFSAWLEDHPKLGNNAIDKATRNHAMQCYDNRDAIEQWRATLATNKRLVVNHPTTVLRGWRASLPDEARAQAAKTNRAAELQEKLATYEAENFKLRQKLEQSGENLFALSDTARNIAMTLAGNLSTGKLADLARELGVELTKRRKMEADKKRAGPK